ncbi:unnamed protein product [Phytomonas sp. EM1]|nr:unnamed protein product [Phytomonas sp. EM1]|eukprot:CCW60298.1 unnamed protein product [Phytomonas sp. isolate EM1]
MAKESIEAVIEQLTYTKGVLGVVVCTADGVPIRDSFQSLDRSVAVAYAEMAAECCRGASALFASTIVKRNTSLKPSFPTKEDSIVESPNNTNLGKQQPPTDAPIRESSLELLRIRTRMNDVIIQCHEEFLLVIVQEPM